MSSAAPRPADHPHRVHGMGTAWEAPTWPAITAGEAAAILAAFPDAGVFAGLRWHSPRPFSAAVLAQTDRGEFFLKRHHRRLRTPEALAEEHAFMAHLRGAGLGVPDVMTARDGSGAVTRGEWSYELHRRSEGDDLYRDRQSWTPFLSAAHAREAGAALARLHLAARGFAAAERGAHPLVASFTILPAPDPLLAAEAYIRARPALGAYLADRAWRAELARLFAALGSGLAERLEHQPLLWTHNDWHPSNLLWSRQGTVRTVFDFGLATQTCALHDLATAIERTAIPWLDIAEGRDSPADARCAQALLSGYRSVLPLSQGQLVTLLRLLPLVHIEFALSEVDYFAGILGDPAQAELAWQGYLIDHADWFLSAAGQAFLGALERGNLA
ncbi:phosphotransferase enzyme family protein [Novosphingobium clariflavum]|uniref:Phosphotransferase enzyme family protein n=1 Tax=Novosphingobium clariflavum TaxID=2029884 RepID=A0ABV6S847_9SPHN|nr:aminoglycoside phosphotransferase family protein [Novosphingobium clariflavum]